MSKGKLLNLIQSTKAERDVGVAAASILARVKFLDELDKLGKELGTNLSKGVNPIVEEIAKEIYKAGGLNELKRFAKIHFKTTEKIKS